MLNIFNLFPSEGIEVCALFKKASDQHVGILIRSPLPSVSSPKNWTFEIWEILVKFKLEIDEKDVCVRELSVPEFVLA